MRRPFPWRPAPRHARALAFAAGLALSALPLTGCAGRESAADGGGPYDLVILNGRVIDPESGLDTVRNVGIAGGAIRAITTQPLTGTTTIDAAGLIVSAGFIDLHSHGQDDENYRAKAMDGVTTALELEVGTDDIDRWYREREGKALVHYAASVGHIPVRMNVMGDPGAFLPSGDGARRPATTEEIAEIRRRIQQGLQRGAMAVGMGLQYTPAASRWEVLEMFRAAAEAGAPVHVHIRHMGDAEPANSLLALEEVIAAAAVTGAPLHVVHVQSSGLRATPRLLQMIGEAQARGMDVTTECYPYTAGMTALESALFDEGWQSVLGIGYDNLEWAATGERLTPATFARYRQTGGFVIIHFIPGDIVNAAVTSPLTMIASDGRLENGRGHPRSSGTYARVLGRYVRDAQALTWMDALRKMTLLPAQRLERRVPMMANKGRVRVGADADLTVFDPQRIVDRSTYQDPALYSEGVRYVLVAGVPVVMDGKLQDGVAPGQAVRAPIKGATAGY
ncbi:MAG: amidohydrolase family protein [Gemmatimonadetes bacterium]|nr:amidohydrolase family protein [Gemmatimonadota bacterium]